MIIYGQGPSADVNPKRNLGGRRISKIGPTSILGLIALLLACAADAEQHPIDGQADVVFLDDYNPVELYLGPGESVEVVSSTVLLDDSDPTSLMQQVIVFQSSYMGRCGYFVPVALGEAVVLSSMPVKVFIPLMATQPTGSAVVRIGTQNVTLTAIDNGIPIDQIAEHFLLPAEGTAVLAVSASDLFLGGNSTIPVDKVVFMIPNATDSIGWLRTVCLGEAPLEVECSSKNRVIYGFIVDHASISDNSGAITVEYEALSAIPSTGGTWGSVKAAFH